MNYEFTSNDKECFSLHDCRADGAELTGDQLILYFTKGIFYNEYGDYWPNTGRAAVEFVIEHVDEITFYLFKEKRKKKIVQEYTARQLVDKISSQKWQLEFLYRYDGYEQTMHSVMVCFDKRPYSYEGQLFIRFKSETFKWNSPVPD